MNLGIKKMAYTLTASAALITGVNAMITFAPETSKEIITTAKDTYDNAKDRFETEQAIKAEGIKAQSYAEAKMKLDSIRLDRACKEVGVPVPKKPDNDASLEEHVRYEMEKSNIYSQQALNTMKQISNKIQAVK